MDSRDATEMDVNQKSWSLAAVTPEDGSKSRLQVRAYSYTPCSIAGKFNSLYWMTVWWTRMYIGRHLI